MAGFNDITMFSNQAEVGANAVGASNTTTIPAIVKVNQNTSTLMKVVNGTGGTGAYAGVQVESSTGDALLLASVDGAYTVNSAIAGYAYIHAIGNTGLILDTDGVFKVTANDAVTFAINMSAAGEIVYPLQPAFLAYNSATDTNATGDGTAVSPVDFDTEVFDQNSDFASDTFTAPVTGKYHLEASVYINVLTVANTTLSISIVTSNSTYSADYPHTSTVTNHSVFLSALCDMDAADTATISVTASGSTKTSGIYGTSAPVTYFSGQLSV